MHFGCPTSPPSLPWGAEDQAFVPNVAHEYGRALGSAGRLDEGLALIAAANRARPNDRSSSWMTRWIESEARLLTSVGRYREAEELFRESQRNRERNHAMVDDWLEHWAERLDTMIATGQAREALTRLLEVAPASAGKASAESKNPRLLAAAELGAGEFAAAERHAKAALERVQADPQRALRPGREAEAERLLGMAQLALGRAEEAQAHLERAEQMLVRLVDARRSPVLASVEVALGECALAAGHMELARRRLAEASAIQRSHAQLGEHYRQPLRALAARLAAARAGSSPAPRM